MSQNMHGRRQLVPHSPQYATVTSQAERGFDKQHGPLNHGGTARCQVLLQKLRIPMDFEGPVKRMPTVLPFCQTISHGVIDPLLTEMRCRCLGRSIVQTISSLAPDSLRSRIATSTVPEGG